MQTIAGQSDEQGDTDTSSGGSIISVLTYLLCLLFSVLPQNWTKGQSQVPPVLILVRSLGRTYVKVPMFISLLSSHSSPAALH